MNYMENNNFNNFDKLYNIYWFDGLNLVKGVWCPGQNKLKPEVGIPLCNAM